MSEPSTVQKPISQKLWHFIEHPLTLTGGAIVLALLGKQSTFFIAWVILTIAFVRTAFFEGQSFTKRFIGNAFASAMLAVIVFVAWKVWFAEPNKPVVTEYIQGLFITFNEFLIKVPWRWVVPVFVLSSVVTAIAVFLIARHRMTPAQSAGAIRWEASGTVTKPCPDQWLHDIADGQVGRVWELVDILKVGAWNHKLDAALPTIKWGLVIKNNSVFSISLDGNIQGYLYFDGTKLPEQRIQVTNEIEDLGHQCEGKITFEQRLSNLEATLIKNFPTGKFTFQGLQIHIKGGTGFDQITSHPLIIPDKFRVVLNDISDSDSQAMEPIIIERDSLQAQISELTSPPGNLVITEGKYGVANLREEDVTGILSRMVVNNSLKLEGLYNDVFPDPLKGTRKQLRINYFHNGVAFSITVPENTKLTLPVAYQKGR